MRRRGDVTFREVVAEAIDWLRQDQRVSYRALKRQFAIDDAYLADLKDELIHIRRVAVDEHGTMLVWMGQLESRDPTLGAPSDSTAEAPVTDVGSRDAGSPSEAATPSAERRQLTVMFCDLVGSTALSGQLDPEDLREIVRAYQRTCTEVIERFDGHVRQFLGDALLVYFGWPHAHEDDARRAVRAGLEMLQAMARVNTSLERESGVRLAVRVGIHTGLVVVGEMGAGQHHEHLALGNAPNVVARVQDRAEPTAVVISEATFRLVHGHFAVDALGAQHLKGVAAPIPLYRVVGENIPASTGRMELDTRGLVPLVGRESELTLLADRWLQSRQRHGQVVLLGGEAGIGKSRLVQALYERVNREDATCIVLRCSPYHTNSTLYPIIEHLRQVLRLAPGDSDKTNLEKLESELARCSLPLVDVVPLVAALLTWPHPESYPLIDLSAQRQRQKTQDVLVTWLLAGPSAGAGGVGRPPLGGRINPRVARLHPGPEPHGRHALHLDQSPGIPPALVAAVTPCASHAESADPRARYRDGAASRRQHGVA
jgi:class 3 adenylate cyclase